MADAKGGDSAKDKKAAQAAKKKAEAEKKAAAEAKKKAEAEHVPLPDDVALYLAGKIKSNIRELEGSLIRLIAYASLTGRQISLPLAQDVLRNILDRDDAKVTIDVIQKSVATRYSLKVSDLKSKNSSKVVAEPRQIAMYLCKSLTSASLPQIGKSFGGKHIVDSMNDLMFHPGLCTHRSSLSNLSYPIEHSAHLVGIRMPHINISPPWVHKMAVLTC